jgi:hypothetical protein
MKLKLILSLSVAAIVPQLAFAEAHPTSGAGVTKAILDYCSKVDSADAGTFGKMWGIFGAAPDAGFEHDYDATMSQLMQLPLATGVQTCGGGAKQFAALGSSNSGGGGGSGQSNPGASGSSSGGGSGNGQSNPGGSGGSASGGGNGQSGSGGSGNPAGGGAKQVDPHQSTSKKPDSPHSGTRS